MKKLQKLLTDYELKKAIKLGYEKEIGEDFEYRIEVGKDCLNLFEFRGSTEDIEFSTIKELKEHLKK